MLTVKVTELNLIVGGPLFPIKEIMISQCYITDYFLMVVEMDIAAMNIVEENNLIGRIVLTTYKDCK